MHHLLDQEERQIHRKAHGQSLFNQIEEPLNMSSELTFHHVSNVRLIESLSDMRNKMFSLLARVE